MSLYLRELQQVVRRGDETISSVQLGSLLGFTDAQVRKDLAFFGQFGYPGIGYKCVELIEEIRKILGTHQDWSVVLVGCGNLGRALLGYRGFQEQGFRVVAAFDADKAKIGKTIEGITVFDFDRMEEVILEKGIRLAVLTVPANHAQQVADRLVGTGVTGILNFAPVTLSLPSHVHSVGVDLAIELEQLAFAVVKSQKNS